MPKKKATAKKKPPPPVRSPLAPWQERFLRALRDLPDVDSACKRAGVRRRVALARRKQDSAFAVSWKRLIDVGVKRLEEELLEEERRTGRLCRGLINKRHEQRIAILRRYKPKVYGKPGPRANEDDRRFMRAIVRKLGLDDEGEPL